jgi:hypothetical protein
MAATDAQNGANSHVALLTEAQNPSSPFYLHPSDNLSYVTATPILQGSQNYLIWSRNMMKALICKDKYGFVTSEIPQPVLGDPLYTAWVKCDTMVTSWLSRSVSPKIASSIAFFDTAKDLWQDLKDRYSKGDFFRLSDLLQAVHSIKQGDRDISQYFIHLKVLWQELEALCPVLQCICVTKCSCPLATGIRSQRDAEYVCCFLKGLNDPYDTVRR